MKTVVLYETDFAGNGTGMSWDSFLESVGIESSTVVGGRIIDKDIDAVTIVVASAHEGFE